MSPKTMQCAQFPFYIYISSTMSSYLDLPKIISILYCILYPLLSTALFCSKYYFVLHKQMITCPPQGETSPQGRRITLVQAPCWTPTLWPPRPPRCCYCCCCCVVVVVVVVVDVDDIDDFLLFLLLLFFWL